MKVAIIGASGSIGKAFVEHFLKSWETKKLYLFSRSDINFDDVRVINHFIDIDNPNEYLVKEVRDVLEKGKPITEKEFINQFTITVNHISILCS